MGERISDRKREQHLAQPDHFLLPPEVFVELRQIRAVESEIAERVSARPVEGSLDHKKKNGESRSLEIRVSGWRVISPEVLLL